MKKIFTLTVSFLLLISTAAWATEREVIELKSECEIEYECEYYLEPKSGDTAPEVKFKIKGDQEWISFKIESKTMTVAESFSYNGEWAAVECSWGVAVGVGEGGKVELEVDVKKIKEMALGVIEKTAGGADLDGDGKLSLGGDGKKAFDESGADPADHVVVFKKPTRPSDENERYEAP
jgi:hypothetical protein